MTRLIIAGFFFFHLASCTAPQVVEIPASFDLDRAAISANVKVGVAQSYVKKVFGDPQMAGSEGEFEFYNYCVYGENVDEMYEFVFRDGILVWKDRYENRKVGPCESFFRKIDVRKIEAAIDKESSVGFDRSVYNIDTLRITTVTNQSSPACSSGSITKMLLEGVIGPDSSFAIAELLRRIPPCTRESGQTLIPVTVSLRSGGGFLKDGFKLGETLRSNGVTTVIEDGRSCASSCAVAFLGGKKRVVEDNASVIFHAPYFSGKNKYGERDVDCKVGDETYKALLNFYIAMTDEDVGERLFDRTLWYCSADDGWVVTGGAAAELYGIATER